VAAERPKPEKCNRLARKPCASNYRQPNKKVLEGLFETAHRRAEETKTSPPLSSFERIKNATWDWRAFFCISLAHEFHPLAHNE
jgi:hypothetical protein